MSVDSAAELDEHPITRHFHKAAVVLCDEWVDDIAPPRSESRQRPCLVLLHKVAVTDDVGRQNGSKTSLDVFLGHEQRLLSRAWRQ